MKLLKISDFFIKTYLSKGSVIAIIISYIVSLSYSIYTIFNNLSSYYYDSNLVNSSYLSNSFNLLNIILIFIISFILLKEANLVSDSASVMLESSFTRISIFISKQIAVISLVFILSCSYFLIFYVPPYIFFNLFKIEFLKSYCILFLYLIIISELFLFFDYLFKNFFITSVFAIMLIILSLFQNSYISYFVPLVKIENNCIVFDINIFYAIMYLTIIFLLNSIIYVKSDRK